MHILLIALLVLALVGLIVAFPQPRQRSRYAPMATSRNATGPASGLRAVEGGTDGDKWDACTGTNGRAQDSPRTPQNAA